MKIVYWAPHVGHVGTIKAVINSAVAMRTHGRHDVIVVRNHTEWEGYEATLERAGVRIADFGLKKWLPGLHRWGGLRGRTYMAVVGLVGFFQLRRLLNDVHADVLITNLVAAPAILAASLCRHRPRIVTSIQGFPKFLGGDVGASRGMWMRLEDAVRKVLWNRLYTRVDLVVCLTEATRQRLASGTRISGQRMVVINNPIIDDAIVALGDAELQDSWFCDGPHKRVVAVGRLTRQKDFKTLIHSIHLARTRVPIRLAILGEGEERASLEVEIARLGLQENVRLYGFVPNPYAYLKRADLFVSTSLWEDPGHAVLEAAAMRTPIVATACTGTESSLGRDGGELCPVGAIDRLADSIARILTRGPDPAKRQVAYERASAFTPRRHYDAFGPHLREWFGATR